MIRLFLIMINLVITLNAYQQGENLDKDIRQKLSINTEKITIIDFFASWCDSCKKELPLLDALYTTMDTNNSDIIGIDVDEDISKATQFQNDIKLHFRLINDPKGDIIKAFDPVGMPAIYIIKNNKITDIIFGAKDNINQIIKDAIERF